MSEAGKVLVLGGGGFLGTNLVRRLLADGHAVRVFDRIAPGRYVKPGPVEFVSGEFGNTGLVREALEGVALVYHLAATTLPETSNEDPAFDVSSNVVDTLHLLEQCVDARVRRVVFVSSGGTVYGIPKSLPITEDHPTEPICSYGIVKLTIEKYLALFQRLHRLEFNALRMSNPYGPHQDPLSRQGAIAVFLHRIATGRPIEIWGDGRVVRDYLYVDDAVQALVLAGTRSDVSGRVLNVSSGRGTTLLALIRKIEEVTGKKARLTHKPPRPVDVPANVLDNARAAEVLGWIPRHDLHAGLVSTFRWMREQVLRSTER